MKIQLIVTIVALGIIFSYLGIEGLLFTFVATVILYIGGNSTVRYNIDLWRALF